MPPKQKPDATAPVQQAASGHAVALPQKFPNSMLVAAIRDRSVQDLLDEEEALRNERAAIRDEMRTVQEAKDKAIRESRPSEDKLKTQISNTAADLHARKDSLYRELDELRAHQEAITHARDALRTHGFQLPDLNREVRTAQMILRDEQRELEQLEKAGDSSRAGAQRKRVEKLSAALQQKTAEQKKADAEHAALKEALDRLSDGETPEQRNKRFHDVRQELGNVQEAIHAIKQSMTRRTGNDAVDALRTKQSALHEKIAKVEARLNAVRRDALPYQHFTYPPGTKMSIVGRNGATLRQLQIDFGVAICIDMVEQGHGFIVGGASDAAACAEAIKELVAGAVSGETETATVHFDPSIKRQIIGTRGATIDSFERESGARLNVKDDCVEIIGSPDAVDVARAALSDFVDNLGTGEMPVDPTRMSQVIGKGGATIAQVERQSGVRSLRMDRARNRLVAVGRQAAIAKAFDMYKEILGEVAGGTVTIQGTDQLVRAIIGTRGRNVRELEEATGARINCDNEANIQITGTPEAVAAAKERIEELRRAETRVPVEARMFNFLTAPLVRVAHGTNSKASGSSEPHISPLEAVQRATGCDQVVPLRSEGVVVVRGRPELAQRAVTMIKQLILRNPPHTVRVPYPEVLRGFLLRRQTAERGSSLLDQVTKRYSAYLRIDLDRDSRTLAITSNDADEVNEAAQEMSELLKDIMARQVRIIEDFPESLLGLLIGPGGTNIRELQESTGTEIAVVRDQGQVQIFSADADAAALDRALAEIHRNILHDGGEEGGDGEGLDTAEGTAA